MIKDEKSREMIVNDFNHTLFVEAGAGSGKTTSMVSRIMSLIINNKCDIQEIIAITFTNDGAASLKSKIQKELEKAFNQDKYALTEKNIIKLNDQQKRRVHEALLHLPLAQISTIHSFCLSIIKERPIECGIDPMIEIYTDLNENELFNNAWCSFLLLKSKENDNFLNFLLEENIDINKIQNIASIKCGHPDLTIYTEPTENITSKDFKKVFNRLKNYANCLQNDLPFFENECDNKIGLKRYNFLKNFIETFNSTPNDKDIKKILLSHDINLTDFSAKKLKKYKDILSQAHDLLQEIRKKYYDFVHYKSSQFINEFEKFYFEFRKVNLKLNYNDLLFITSRILRDNIEVRNYFKKKYKYIFVDESQDIDPMQIELVFLLSEKIDNNAKTWEKVILEPSKLFMVGDPKQSIYKFRRADIQVYSKAKNIIKNQGGLILSLNKNFRSDKTIIDFVNNHFQESFKEFSDFIKSGIQAEYTPISFAKISNSVIKDNIFRINVENEDKFEDETKKIVYIINTIVNNKNYKIFDEEKNTLRNIQFSDIVLLSKTQTNINEFVRILEENNIPNFLVGGKTFFDSDEIRGLIFSLQAIDDPNNSIALFGALKSSLFKFSDLEILEYVTNNNNLSYFPKNENETPISKVLTYFKELHYRKNELNPSDILKDIFDKTGICHILLLKENGLQKTARLYRLLELLYEIEENVTLSFHEIINSLINLMDSDDFRLSTININEYNSNAVRLMTIHKSKGLEAPVIFIIDCYQKNEINKFSYYTLREKNSIIIPLLDLGGFYSLDSEKLQNIESNLEKCELERLRYVAATRAKNILAISIPNENEKFISSFENTLSKFEKTKTISKINLETKKEIKRKQINIEQLFKKYTNDRDLMISNLENKINEFQSPFTSVHNLMSYDIKDPILRTCKSRGVEFGNIIHHIMEKYMTEPDFNIHSFVDKIIEEDPLNLKYKDEIISAFNILKNNTFVQEAFSSKEKYCEWEFYLSKNNKIITGIIDIIYKKDNGNWGILDYKTDDISDSEKKSVLEKLYSNQLEIYKSCFEEITGNKVDKCEIIWLE